MGLKGDKNTQINLAGKSKNSLKKIVVQRVYYCGKRLKILLLNCEESAFGAEASAKLVPRIEEKNLFVCQENCKNGFVNSNGVERL